MVDTRGGSSVEDAERLEALAALRASERRYRSLVEATTSVVWHVVPEETDGHAWLQGIHPDDRERAAAEWTAAATAERVFETELRIGAGRRTRDVLVRAVPIIEGGRVVEWIGSSTDVTERRRVDRERLELQQQREAAAARTATLGQVAGALTEALRERDVARIVLASATAALDAHGGAVALFDPDGTTLRFVATTWPPEQEAVLLGSDLSVDRPSSHAARLREPVFLENAAEVRSRFPAVKHLFEVLGDQAAASMPLRVRGQCLGSMAIHFAGPRLFPVEDRLLLTALADTCAQALERARLYEREHGVAETLQRALLPVRLVDREGITTAARYLPGTEGIAVGGDWYDVFDLGDNRLGIVLGDVVGKGVAAAAVMGQLRHGLRAFATSIDGPGDVVERVDDFAARFGDDDLATLVYGVLDIGTGELRFSRAGHLPPLLIDADGGATFLDREPDLPVGVATGVVRHEHRLRLPAGSTLVLYSDGLVEDRARSLDEGMARLRAVGAAGASAGPEPLCERIVREMVGEEGGEDDVAVLVLRWDGPPSTDRCSTVLPPVVASARRARALVAEQLERWGEPGLVETGILCVSEIVTNAIVHAATMVHLDIVLGVERVRVAVSDGGAAPPERIHPADDDSHGRGVAIVEALSAGWGVDLLEDGKTVWFELARDGAGRPPTSEAS